VRTKPVDDVQVVEVLEGQHNLRAEERGVILTAGGRGGEG